MRDKYKNQVSLLIDMLPYALKDKRVALKGGTAINLFYRELPRLSVDIDLCYLNLEDRQTTFKNLHEILAQIKRDLESNLQASVLVTNPLDGKKESKLIARVGEIEIKIEPNFILRGSLFGYKELETTQTVTNEFNKKAIVQCLSLEDTFGGKICAALDRQHPRDLFDVKMRLEKEGISSDIKDAFLFYLLSHNRPINELLNPNDKNISQTYTDEFLDMANNEIALDELLETRKNLKKKVQQSLSITDKEFIISFVKNSPNWEKMSIQKIKDFPSIKWKLFNQEKMSAKKQGEYIKEVEKCLL
jgi:predicted nucleotidyltransferase component of viral defense system